MPLAGGWPAIAYPRTPFMKDGVPPCGTTVMQVGVAGACYWAVVADAMTSGVTDAEIVAESMLVQSPSRNVAYSSCKGLGASRPCTAI